MCEQSCLATKFLCMMYLLYCKCKYSKTSIILHPLILHFLHVTIIQPIYTTINQSIQQYNQSLQQYNQSIQQYNQSIHTNYYSILNFPDEILGTDRLSDCCVLYNTHSDCLFLLNVMMAQWRTEGEVSGFNPPPPKFRRPSKIVPNSTRL